MRLTRTMPPRNVDVWGTIAVGADDDDGIEIL